MRALKCVNPFTGYERNQIVTEPEEVERLLRSDRAHHFHKLTLPDPAPPAETAPQKGPV